MPKKIYTLEDYRRVGQELFDRMHLPTYPIAAKFIKSVDEIPEEVRRPELEGFKMSICQCLTKARRLGEAWALTAVDNFCTPITVGFGWVPDITVDEFIESQIKQKWDKDPEALRKVEEETESYRSHTKTGYETLRKQAQQMLAQQKLGNIGIMTAPLHSTPFIPDTIVVYGTPLQINYLIDAFSIEKKRKYEIKTPFAGFGECSKGTIQPHLMQKPFIIIPGNGDRSYGGIHDYEIGMGMPVDFAFYALENLFKAWKGQGKLVPFRQELPSVDEKITPGYIYLREVIDRKLKEQKEQLLKSEAVN